MQGGKSYSKYELLKTSWRYQTKQFFDNSTLHGVRYIAQEDRSIAEKLLWFACTVTGCIVTIIIIVSLWEKFQTNPTITGLDTDFHNWDVEFPGITICQQNPTNDTTIQAFIDSNYDKLTDQQKTELAKYLKALGDLSYATLPNLQNFTKKTYLPQDALKSVAFQIVNHCEDIMSDCKWKDTSVECCEKFFPIFTERGLCYGFNLRHSEKSWPWGQGKAPPFNQEFIYETDVKWAISFNIHNVHENPVYVYIHSSEEQPGIDMEPQHMWTRRVSKIAFSSKATYTTDDAKQLSIKQRRCVFANEIKLITDDVYSYGACMRECRMKRALAMCKCVPFFYIQLKEYPYCALEDIPCLIKDLAELTRKDICPCELGCKNTVYEVEKLTESIERDVTEPLETAFVSWPMIRYKREVLFGWVDLLVAFGGIAGLFLGFSLLSGVEIIYYFTMRSCCMFLRDKKDLEKLKNEYENMETPPLDLSLRPTFLKKDPSSGSAGITHVRPLQMKQGGLMSHHVDPIQPMHPYIFNILH